MAGLVYSAAMDFALAFFPWRILWKTQMVRKEKIGVALAMSFGVLYVLNLLCSYLPMVLADAIGTAPA